VFEIKGQRYRPLGEPHELPSDVLVYLGVGRIESGPAAVRRAGIAAYVVEGDPRTG